MPRFNPFPKRKSPLNIEQKALVAARGVYQVATNQIEAGELGLRMREEVGLQWTFLSAAQFLTGAPAMAAIVSLPGDFTYEGLTKTNLLEAVGLANGLCANASASGRAMSSGPLVEKFTGLGKP